VKEEVIRAGAMPVTHSRGCPYDVSRTNVYRTVVVGNDSFACDHEENLTTLMRVPMSPGAGVEEHIGHIDAVSLRHDDIAPHCPVKCFCDDVGGCLGPASDNCDHVSRHLSFDRVSHLKEAAEKQTCLAEHASLDDPEVMTWDDFAIERLDSLDAVLVGNEVGVEAYGDVRDVLVPLPVLV